MYSSYTVFDYDAALPDTDESINRLEYLAWQAMDAAINASGPVHLNLPYDKPLEPRRADLLNTAEYKTSVARWVNKDKPVTIEAGDVPPSVLEVRRPLVVAGPMIGTNIHAEKWVEALSGSGIPVIASLASGLTYSSLTGELINGYHRILRDPDARRSLRPDLIIRLGHFPVLKPVELYLEENSDVVEWSVLPQGLSGSPHNPSGFRMDGIPSKALLQQLASNMDPGWRSAWSALEPTVPVYRDDVLTDGGVHRTVLANLPVGDNLCVSNSLPVRDLDAFGQGWSYDNHKIFSARGVSGIDGVTSQAIGTAIGSKTNTVLFTGDLAFLHDSNALMLQSLVSDVRVAVVVINNGGGKIFKSLPIAEFGDLYDQYFGTPQPTDFSRLCEAHGVRYAKATTQSELAEHLRELLQSKGIIVIECVTDPEASQAERLL
jgi:2-succinyl-5-enolpyruvyl-6-hydroxy-3-cyclohexene-1-carboxylate synthase